MFVCAPLALLASLLSAFAIPFVDAAYLPGRRPETQNVHRFSPVIPPPRFGHHGPASGRHYSGNERAHNKVPKSVFSRDRYRRDAGTLTRRSSVYLLGEHGDKYLVSRSGVVSKEQNSQSRVHGRRQSNQVLGRVDVMGAAQSSGSPQRLASLSVDSTPTDLMPGQNATKVFGVNASTTNRTQFIMMALDEPSDNMSFHKRVSLAIQVFDAESVKPAMYCATYDPDPVAASALTMEPCAALSAPVSAPENATTDTTPSSNPHQRQIFSYDPLSGQIQPMASVTDADTSGQDTHCGRSEERRDIANSTTSSSQTASNTQSSVAPTPSPLQHAQNVTLVYVPEDLEVPVSSRSTDASQGQVEAVMTTTITTTVVATVTASVSSSKSQTHAQAAASVSTPSTTATPTPTRPSTPSASVSATASPKSSSVPNESLEIEIVGVAPTTTARSSSVSSTTTTHISTSPSLNAQAVASSIANSRSSKSQSSSSATSTATPVVVAVAGRSRVFGRM